MSEKTLYQKALALQELLGERTRWLRCRPAIDADYRNVSPVDPSACRFCLVGAIARTEGIENDIYTAAGKSDLGKLIKSVIAGMPDERLYPNPVDESQDIYRFNDFRPYEDVMEVLGTAVELAKGAE